MALLAGIWLNLLLLVVATRSIWNFDHRITRKKVIGGSHGKDPRCTPGGPAKFLALPPTICSIHTPGGPAKFLALPPTICIIHTPGGPAKFLALPPTTYNIHYTYTRELFMCFRISDFGFRIFKKRIFKNEIRISDI